MCKPHSSITKSAACYHLASPESSWITVHSRNLKRCKSNHVTILDYSAALETLSTLMD